MEIYPNGTAINLGASLFQRFAGANSIVELDSCNTSAGAVWTVCKPDALDGSSNLLKIFLGGKNPRSVCSSKV